MGVSATGERGLRPSTVRALFWESLVGLVLAAYLLGPPVVPMLRHAAVEECNRLARSDFRSFRLAWELPRSPAWDLPHWSCGDAQKPFEPPASLGWWVNPF